MSLLKNGGSKALRKLREKLQSIGNGYSPNMDYQIVMKMSHGIVSAYFASDENILGYKNIIPVL